MSISMLTRSTINSKSISMITSQVPEPKVHEPICGMEFWMQQSQRQEMQESMQTPKGEFPGESTKIQAQRQGRNIRANMPGRVQKGSQIAYLFFNTCDCRTTAEQLDRYLFLFLAVHMKQFSLTHRHYAVNPLVLVDLKPRSICCCWKVLWLPYITIPYGCCTLSHSKPNRCSDGRTGTQLHGTRTHRRDFSYVIIYAHGWCVFPSANEEMTDLLFIWVSQEKITWRVVQISIVI